MITHILIFFFPAYCKEGSSYFYHHSHFAVTLTVGLSILSPLLSVVPDTSKELKKQLVFH